MISAYTSCFVTYKPTITGAIKQEIQHKVEFLSVNRCGFSKILNLLIVVVYVLLCKIPKARPAVEITDSE